ncbi:MAG TPA: acylphosphatase [archaeon]|nr:acylphosphatase [archaeon]
MAKCEFFIHNHVQDVGYRLFITEKILESNLRGGAYNTPDKKVRVLLEGEQTEILELIDLLKNQYPKEALNPKLLNPVFDESLNVPDAMRSSQSLQAGQFIKAVEIITGMHGDMNTNFKNLSNGLNQNFENLSTNMNTNFENLSTDVKELKTEFGKLRENLDKNFEKLPKQLGEELKPEFKNLPKQIALELRKDFENLPKQIGLELKKGFDQMPIKLASELRKDFDVLPERIAKAIKEVNQRG